jgi:type II secretory pathway pseudopilin PulG
MKVRIFDTKAGRPDGEAGFTFIELVVTATMIAVATTAIVSIFIAVGIQNRQAKNLAIATQQLQIKLETYRNQTYSAVPIGSPAEDFTASLPLDLASPRSAIVRVTENPAGLKLVEIEISYTDGKVTKRVQSSSYVALHGVGR